MATTRTRSVHRSDPNRQNRSYVYHPSFREAYAESLFDRSVDQVVEKYADSYMPDDVTRELARCMHYAAFRRAHAKTVAAAKQWAERFHALRNCIVMGNRKLVYKVVTRRANGNPWTDDLIGEGHIVLIKAVSGFNPWLGIRFSTYAYTCLVRVVVRWARRRDTVSLTNDLILEELAGGGALFEDNEEQQVRLKMLNSYLHGDKTLLSPREKIILTRRYSLANAGRNRTLVTLGRDLGLSKERVRQVQIDALGKLRQALQPRSAC